MSLDKETSCRFKAITQLTVSFPVMELKVWVDGVARVVCGLSVNTSCQDVVIALAQSLGMFFSDNILLTKLPFFYL